MEPGAILGDRFEIIGVLGRGGMATVYLANDRDRGERLALKVLHPHLADDPGMRQRLQREVAAAALIRHPGALVAHDLHRLDGQLVLSMPYHPGATLADRVAADGPLAAQRVRALGVTLAEVLAEAHRGGLLHRDVTPKNVMVGEDGDVQLADFGLARLQGMEGTATAAMGTPGYAAPELFHGEEADPRADLYGLGCVLYLAATGHPPFAGSPAEVLERQLSGRHRPVAALAPDLPADLAQTIESLLAPRPEGRPGAAAEVVRALDGGRPLRRITVRSPSSNPAPTVGGGKHGPARSVDLESGPCTVVLRTLPNSDVSRDPARVVHALTEVAGLPPGGLVKSPILEHKRFRLVTGVSRSVADRLATGASTGGFRATVHDQAWDDRNRWSAFWWLPIPLMWISFPWLGDALGGGVLWVFVAATVILGVLGPGRSKRLLPGGLALAYAPSLAGGADRATEQPVAHTEAPIQVSDGVAGAARTALAALRRSLESPALAAVVARDLGGTAQALASEVDELDAALKTEPPTAPVVDRSWLRGKLERYATLERAGSPVSSAERSRVQAAMVAMERADEAADAVATMHTAARARLLEITATADEVRLGLVDTPPAETQRLVERLRRDADAASAARRELARRRVPEG
jgi:serine/threonine protein kinase